MPHKELNLPAMDFLLNRIEKMKNGCWLWTACTDKDGYGLTCHLPYRTTKLGIRLKRWRVPRLVYFLTRGHIPNNQLICHKCDTPQCCNPFHLFAGTSKQNIFDAILKDRVPRGKRHWLFGKKRPPHVGRAVAKSNRERKQPINPKTGQFVKIKRKQSEAA